MIDGSNCSASWWTRIWSMSDMSTTSGRRSDEVDPDPAVRRQLRHRAAGVPGGRRVSRRQPHLPALEMAVDLFHSGLLAEPEATAAIGSACWGRGHVETASRALGADRGSRLPSFVHPAGTAVPRGVTGTRDRLPADLGRLWSEGVAAHRPSSASSRRPDRTTMRLARRARSAGRTDGTNGTRRTSSSSDSRRADARTWNPDVDRLATQTEFGFVTNDGRAPPSLTPSPGSGGASPRPAGPWPTTESGSSSSGRRDSGRSNQVRQSEIAPEGSRRRPRQTWDASGSARVVPSAGVRGCRDPRRRLLRRWPRRCRAGAVRPPPWPSPRRRSWCPARSRTGPR